IVTIGKNSALEIEKFLFDEKNAKNEAEISLSKGAFRTITGQIGKIAPETFKLKTRTTSIGIRGTQFLVDITEIGERFACTQGEITLDNGGAVAALRAGEIAIFENGAILQPRNFKPEEVLKIIEKIDGAPIVVNPNTFVMDADSAIASDQSSSGANVSLNPAQDLSDAANQVNTVSLGLYDRQIMGMSVPKLDVDDALNPQIQTSPPSGSNPPAIDFVYMPNLYYVDPYVDWGFWVDVDRNTFLNGNNVAVAMTDHHIVGGLYGTKTDDSVISLLLSQKDKRFDYKGEVTGRVLYAADDTGSTPVYAASSIIPNSPGQQNKNWFKMYVDFGAGKYGFEAAFTAELTGERFVIATIDGSPATTGFDKIKQPINYDGATSCSVGISCPFENKGQYPSTTPSLQEEQGAWKIYFFGPNAESVAGLVEYNRKLASGTCDKDCIARVQLLVKGNRNR
ncbi:MAG: FecR family protein, partial [Helicobacteraceae bacterium]|nr:FecR family protein [Helicobacteraceae bacterium]